MKKLQKKDTALTVIEMLIAIGIFSIIMGILVLNFENSRKSSRDSVRLSDIQRIADMLENYYLKNKNTYPVVSGKVTIHSKDNSDWTSLKNTLNQGILPVDPLANTTYYYTYCVDNASVATQYVLMVRLETSNRVVVERGHRGTLGGCDCSTSGSETTPPYLYCLHSP